KGLGWTLTIMAVFISVYFVFISGMNDWEISQQNGTVILAGVKLTVSSSFSTYDIINTKVNSTAIITAPNLGNISIEPNSEFKRLDKKNTAELVIGKISVDWASDEELFKLKIPSAMISNKSPGSIYTVRVKADRSGEIFVKSGMINVTYENKEVIAAANYYIEFDEKLGVSMPFHKNSDPDFIAAVREFLLTRSELHVERIVSLSTKLNSLTLWNLFRFINPAKRLLVYRKLNELVPHSNKITNKDVLDLNPEKLQIWLDEITK
ncbi:MAG: hypothetical protein R3250_15205, partial [Melioribacteraceae bacterium]|nr:hypothetical protein [Melioribacteraceae bacterium]